MSDDEIVIREKHATDRTAVSELLSHAFGPGRFARSAYRVREASSDIDTTTEFDLCAWLGDQLVGAIHFSKITIGGKPGAVLLGPLAIDPNYAGHGCGQRLISEGLAKISAAGHRLVVLVGDVSYYKKFGFEALPAGKIRLPGPVDPNRLLVRELQQGASDEFSGLIAASAN